VREQTPSQTVGPFFHDALVHEDQEVIARPDTPGERIEIVGRIVDASGDPVADALVEVWHADAHGRYDGAVRGFGRCATRPDGSFRFVTVRPGAVPGPGSTLQAPHVAVGLFARGLLKRLVTRIYFEDSPENAADPVLALIDPGRRATLLARRLAADAVVYRFDIALSGDRETVFFAC
jgi:protocatechuate 3,4-dioxygenase alpha subunit